MSFMMETAFTFYAGIGLFVAGVAHMYSKDTK